jgi:hypothetical protein
VNPVLENKMKLSGNYLLEDLRRVFQGNFACKEFTRDSKGKMLSEQKQCIRLEIFFIAFEFYPKTGDIIISKVTDDDKGTTTLKPIIKISGTPL